MKLQNKQRFCIFFLYLFFIPGLVWYFFDSKLRKDSFVRFHFEQWFIAVLGSCIWLFAYSIIFPFLRVITLDYFGVVGRIGYFVPAVIFIQGAYYAIKGEKKKLWIVGKYNLKK